MSAFGDGNSARPIAENDCWAPSFPSRFVNVLSSDNKLAYAYLLTPRGASAKLQLAHDFLARKEREFDRLQREIAGRASRRLSHSWVLFSSAGMPGAAATNCSVKAGVTELE